MTGPSDGAPPGQQFSDHPDFYENSAYGVFPQEHRSMGGFGAVISEVHQSPIDYIDAALPCLVIQTATNPVREVGLDVGDGFRVQSDLPANTLTVTPPQTEERFYVPEAHALRLLSVPQAAVERVLEAQGLTASVFNAYVGRMVCNRAAYGTLDQLWRVSALGDGRGGLYFDSLVLKLFAQLAGGPATSSVVEAAREDQRIARAVEYLEAHIAQSLTIADLAQAPNLSAGQFSRTFKAATGEPVWTYVRRRRCERAREMLILTSLPIAQIAYRCGFSSQAHMTTAIKRQFAVTPAALRGA